MYIVYVELNTNQISTNQIKNNNENIGSYGQIVNFIRQW